METQHITVADERIALFDNGGQGRNRGGIFFLHGNSTSCRIFDRQFESRLGDKYRMVAIDLPGHGLSDDARKPNQRYTPKGYSELILDVLTTFGEQSWILVGHSLGGHILLEAAEKLAAPQVQGLMLVSSPPIRNASSLLQAYWPSRTMEIIFQERLSDSEISQLAAAQVQSGNEIPPFLTSVYRRSDPQARLILAQTVQQDEFPDEVSIIERLPCPVALVAGASESIINLSYLHELSQNIPIWEGSVKLIEGASHLPQWELSGEYNRLLDRFATYCLETGRDEERGIHR